MARQKTHVVYNNFVKGLITEVSDINFPPNASLDESNCVLFPQGNRRRRLGVDYISGATLSSDTFALPSRNLTEFSYYRWLAPAGDGSLEIVVFQIGATLYFYDASDLSSIGTLDLTPQAIAGATNILDDKVSMASARGKLFVVGKQLQPFYITFVPSNGSLTPTSITLQVRDLVGIDDGLELTQTPLTLANLHKYNLYNQGWNPKANGTDNIADYFADVAHYPSNVMIWTYGRSASGNMDGAAIDRTDFGNSPAPKGHFLIDPFNIDRATVSGIVGIPSSSIDARPTCIASFAGRVFYSGVEADGFAGVVYFSHIINSDITNAGDCYQIADPTSENDSTLVDDDGGTLPIADIGKIIGMKVIGDTLCVFANNGIWGITGGDTGGYFKATSFSVYQITNIGVVSIDSICLVAGTVVYWADSGIYSVIRDNISGRFSVQSLTLNTIQTLFSDITSEVANNVQAIYDESNHQIQFLYSSVDNDTSYTRKTILILDLTLNAFFKHDISSLVSNSPIIIGAINSENNTAWYGSAIRYLTAVPGSGTYKFTFSEFNNTAFMDWFTKDSTGITYSSFLEAGFEYTGDVMLNKQAPYVLAYLEQTETGFVENEDDGFDLVNPSSCFMQAKWDWANVSSSNRWSEEKQVYRLQRLQLPDEDDLSLAYGQSVIVTKNKIRGKGRAIRTRWRSEDGKDFNLLGWAATYTVDTDV